ncbi:hypothetical protein FOZ61_004448 [Perkinsus olseni]|uniref:Uncharacterized protein n=1 Tax=Perkinsus olseni TaxID=32597 RepID=A0A7J6LL00_PEROL|nr:hypothetical protein FOZ61_004448 [Perkinsus olseni]
MPGSSDTTTWKDISTLDSGGLAEYLRSRGFKVASAIVWLESSAKASGWHLKNWAKAVEGLQVQQMREMVDRVYREDTERFRSFGVFAGMHSSVPMKELEELVRLGCNDEPPPDGIEPDAVEGSAEGELLTTQEMDDAGASPANCQDILGVSSLSSEGVEEVMESVLEETQPPYGCFLGDAKREEGQGAVESGDPDGDAEMEGPDDAVAAEEGAGSGVSSEGSSCSSSPVARTSSGRRMSSTSHKVLMLSGVGVAIERSANGLCNRLGGAKIESLDRCLEKGVTPKPSHVIVPNKKAVVTLKVLYGLCTPTCSIVREGWLAACRSASQWLPVDQYLVEDWADRPSWTVGKSFGVLCNHVKFGPQQICDLQGNGSSALRNCCYFCRARSYFLADSLSTGMSNRLFLSSLRGVRRLANANDETRQQAGKMRSAGEEGGQSAEEIVMQDVGGDDNKGSAGVVRKGRGHGGERALLEAPLLSSSARRRRTARASAADVAMEDGEFGNHNRGGAAANDDTSFINSYYPRGSGGKDAWKHDMYSGPMSAGSWVFVRNCPSTVTPQQLYHLFQSTVNSPVVSVKVHRGSIPTALIGFVRRDAAETAEQKLHGRDVDGTMLKVCKVDESVAEIEEPDEEEGDARAYSNGRARTPPQRARSYGAPRRGGWGSRSAPAQNSEEQLDLPRSARGRKANTFDSLPSLAGDDSKDQEDASVLPSPVRGWNMSSAGMDGLSWTVELHRVEGDRLGIDVDHQYPEYLLVERVTNGGVVERFNTENPSLALSRGDHIVRVNDVTGDSLKMIECCRKEKHLVWRVVRGK